MKLNIRSKKAILLIVVSIVCNVEAEITKFKKAKKYQGIVTIEKIINHPIKDVWSQFIEFENWVTSARIEPISSENTMVVGEISKTTPQYGVSLKKPEYYYIWKTMHIVPQRELVYTAYIENPSVWGYEATSFHHWKLSEINGSTAISLSTYWEVSTTSEEYGRTLQLNGGPFYQKIWNENLRNLENVVAKGLKGL